MSWKKKYNLPIVVFVWIGLAGTWAIWGPAFQSEKVVDPPSARSEIFSRENVQQRSEYIHQILANPKTDEIPADIHEMEMKFAKELRYKNDQLFLKMQKAEGSESAQETALNWTALGPKNIGGRTRAVAFDISNENVILAAGVTGGVWRSEDGGQSWTKTTDPEQLHSVTCIVQDIRPGKQNIWYYGTGELVGNSARATGAPFRGDGIYKSTNGGRSWEPLASTQVNEPANFSSPFMYVWDIEVNPQSSNDEVIAAIFGGVVRSTDGGQSWNTVLGQDLINQPEGTDLNEVVSIFYTDVYRAADNTFYASLSNVTNDAQVLAKNAGIYKSTDGGVTWQNKNGLSNLPFRRTEFGSSAANPNIVYSITDAESGYMLKKYNAISDDFTDLSNNIPDGSDEEEEIEEFDSQGSYDLFVAVHPADPDVVFLGGTNLYRSTDGFSSKGNTSWIGGYNPSNDGGSIYPNHHPDQHDLIFLPSDPNVMISANDGGLHKTVDNLADEVVYEPLNNGYVTTQYYTVSISQSPNDEFAFGGLQDNGSILSPFDGSNIGLPIINGDGGFTASTRFGIYYYMSFQNGQVYRLTFNKNIELTSFARVDPVGAGADPTQPVLFVNPYVLDPNNGNRMYYTGGDFIWRNKNLSQIPAGSQNKTSVNWDRLTRTEVLTGSISALDISSDQANILFYGTSIGELFRVDNVHSDEYLVTNVSSPLFPTNGYINSISINPTDANEVVVVFSNYQVLSVFHSTDGGQNFENVSGNLEENPDGSGNGPSVRWVEVVPKSDGSTEYFVATSIGLYSAKTLNGENTLWIEEGKQTIGNVPVNMLDYRRSDGKVVAATHGTGLFLSQIQDVEPYPDLNSETKLVVGNAFPNPFSDEIAISFNVPETDYVRVRVYDMNGSIVKTIALGLAFKGENEIFWDGTNTQDQLVSSGVYLIRLEYKGEITAQRIIYTKR